MVNESDIIQSRHGIINVATASKDGQSSGNEGRRKRKCGKCACVDSFFCEFAVVLYTARLKPGEMLPRHGAGRWTQGDYNTFP